jgi:hypothetical protein
MATFKGQITHILPIWEKDNSASIEFRLENTDGKYPESAVFKKFAKDDNKKYVLEFEKYNKIGDVVEVEYSQKAKEWKEKWFNENNVFKINNLDYNAKAHSEIKSSSASGQILDKQFENITSKDDDGSLPF